MYISRSPRAQILLVKINSQRLLNHIRKEEIRILFQPTTHNFTKHHQSSVIRQRRLHSSFNLNRVATSEKHHHHDQRFLCRYRLQACQ